MWQRWAPVVGLNYTPVTARLLIVALYGVMSYEDYMENAEKTVFHYTSLDGLLGVAESDVIWATNILYLNDASELHYAKSLLMEELAAYRYTHEAFAKADTLDKSLGHFFLDSLQNNINTLLPSPTIAFFVCSFSEDGDLLSQWRGYSKAGQGFSLGFSLNRLKSCVKKAHFSIKKVIYDQNEQISEIRKLLTDLHTNFLAEIGNSVDKRQAWDEKAKGLLSAFLLEFIRLAPLIKHPKFAEEKEWRVMAALNTVNSSRGVKFRAGSTMVVPYIEVPLPKDGNSLALDEVIVGPTNERTLSAESVKMLFGSHKVKCAGVNYSTIPYRTL
jgi:hypothetical protein